MSRPRRPIPDPGHVYCGDCACRSSWVWCAVAQRYITGAPIVCTVYRPHERAGWRALGDVLCAACAHCPGLGSTCAQTRRRVSGQRVRCVFFDPRGGTLPGHAYCTVGDPPDLILWGGRGVGLLRIAAPRFEAAFVGLSRH